MNKGHLYQRLVSSGYSHGIVSALYGVMAFVISVPVVLAYALRGSFDVVMIAVLLIITFAFVLLSANRRILT